MIDHQRRLIELCIATENDLSGADILPRPGRMSILFFCALVEPVPLYFFRQDIREQVRAQIRSLPISALSTAMDRVKKLLADYHCDETYWGETFYFPTLPPPDHSPDVVVRLVEDQEVFAVERNGQIVSRAWTWGECAAAAEVEVETLPGYRRRGYARQVVAAWAARQMRNGKTAFFSHEYANRGSGKLAEKLDLRLIAPILIFYQHEEDPAA